MTLSSSRANFNSCRLSLLCGLCSRLAKSTFSWVRLLSSRRAFPFQWWTLHGPPSSPGASCTLCPLPCGGVERLHALEIGADFPSSRLLFISKGFCLSSLGCIHFPSLLLRFIALTGSFIFILQTCPKCILILVSFDF